MANFVLVGELMDETGKLVISFKAYHQAEVKGILFIIEVDHALPPWSTESKLIDL